MESNLTNPKSTNCINKTQIEEDLECFYLADSRIEQYQKFVLSDERYDIVLQEMQETVKTRPKCNTCNLSIYPTLSEKCLFCEICENMLIIIGKYESYCQKSESCLRVFCDITTDRTFTIYCEMIAFFAYCRDILNLIKPSIITSKIQKSPSMFYAFRESYESFIDIILMMKNKQLIRLKSAYLKYEADRTDENYKKFEHEHKKHTTSKIRHNSWYNIGESDKKTHCDIVSKFLADEFDPEIIKKAFELSKKSSSRGHNYSQMHSDNMNILARTTKTHLHILYYSFYMMCIIMIQIQSLPNKP